MESVNKKILNPIKFSFNDIPKFEDNNKFNNNGKLIKSKSHSEIKSKLIKSLKTTQSNSSNKKSKLLSDNSNKKEYSKCDQENIYKKANLKNVSFPLKLKSSSKPLKPIADLRRKKDYIKDFPINDNQTSILKNNYKLSDLVEEKRNHLLSKKSLESLNMELFDKKINSDSHLKEINSSTLNINMSSLEKNENIINNENRLSTITARVKKLEQQLSITMKELQEKNNIIYELKKELKERNLLLKSSSDEKILLLEKKIKKSQKKLELAYNYLKHYNITIDDDDKSEIESDQSVFGDDVNNDTKGFIHEFPYDFNQFSKQIKFLNHLSEEGIGQIVQHKNGAYTIKMPEPQILNVYSNGFIFDNQFHSFSEKDSILFIKEIVDGYFPFQLKDKYPEGVPFKLIDNHLSYYNNRPSYSPFSGKGVLVKPLSSSMASENSDNLSLDEKLNINTSYEGKESNKLISSQIDTCSENNKNNNINNKSTEAILLESTKKSFLDILPKNTVKDGYIIDIKKATNNILFKEEKDLIEMGVEDDDEDISLETGKGNINSENEKITTIKIRNNTKEYIVQMKYSDTIKLLKENLEKKLCIKKDQFKLKMPFQFNDFEDYKTLEESSLIPNACLYIETI
ncbi:hypothetical protein BCR36DRAFT_415838 [Piromyces finnis]|uniref:SEP domain-containing protein n=1 Tax=Piromyces finnis TaxID=1754191 RepID=A0A1Y1UXU4_9FUNG|nr:hypothetical protein BCR36DRAFT_415838 [Piromyces finnis]|eukprot:ORX42991.1 hypothetical protein BCR36DRAFT_415838 [Piromyces finnis]